MGTLFRDAHTIKGGAAMLGFDDIRTLAHAVEDVFGAVRDTGVFPAELAAPLLRATGALRGLVAGNGEPISGLLDQLAAGQAAVLGSGAATAASAGSPGAAGPSGSTEEPGPADVPSPAGEPGPAGERGAAGVPPVPAEKGVLRVSAEKIDHLLDEVGEFMQHRGQLIHSLGDRERLGQEAVDALGVGDRIFAELKDTAVGMRTLPVAMITGPLPRAVRDLAHEQGKEVEFVVHGADTELDRVILESLTEPLTHLLRNAISHGIESPAERERVHKPRRGRVELGAVPRGSVVEVVVSDDGRGVPPEVIGRAQHEGSLTEMLTRPGFSTAAQVSDIAGRGVGLDAVNAYVRSLGGSIEVSSEPGRGTKVALVLPLALALLEVLLVERGGAVYGVPLAAVEEVMMVSRTLALGGRAVLEMRGRALPVEDFAALVGAQAPPAAGRSPALVITASGRQAVVICDALVGQEEVVVKPLGPLLADVAGYLGAAILGDGRIALLVEPARLTRGSRPAAHGEVPPAAAPEPPRILVVEDSFTVRELQRSILEAAGYPVATARDGRDALRVLGDDTGIALVITDLEMPELDGFGLTRAIRADPGRRSLPVVIVTSHGSEEDRREGAEAGADAYLTKQDFDQHALLATVERLVGR